MRADGHSIILYNRKKVEATQVSIGRCMDDQHVVYAGN